MKENNVEYMKVYFYHLNSFNVKETATFIIIFRKASASFSLRQQTPWNVIADDNELIKVYYTRNL